ncbi:Threonine--tRNA ligase, partial [Haemophilus influenzae]
RAYFTPCALYACLW